MFRAGLVALVGKPNVGKSTLMNHIVGQKVSIVSDKPQTTRRRAVGIVTTAEYQIAFVDTPGVHTPRTQLDKSMVDATRSGLHGVDVIVVVVDGGRHPGEQDREVAQVLETSANENTPRLLCINKMDHLKPENVTGFVEAYSSLFHPADYVLTTASRGFNVSILVNQIVERLPEQEALYSEDEVTDQSSRFMAAEFVREQIVGATRQEVPYATAVTVDSWEEQESGRVIISATIIVDKSSQRAILIGQEGSFLKRIGSAARQEIESLLGRPVYLNLHVRVQEGWRMNPGLIHELEYGERW
ncbi:MAG: GTPase Era [Fimbriimonadaceae bacterium]